MTLHLAHHPRRTPELRIRSPSVRRVRLQRTRQLSKQRTELAGARRLGRFLDQGVDVANLRASQADTGWARACVKPEWPLEMREVRDADRRLGVGELQQQRRPRVVLLVARAVPQAAIEKDGVPLRHIGLDHFCRGVVLARQLERDVFRQIVAPQPSLVSRLLDRPAEAVGPRRQSERRAPAHVLETDPRRYTTCIRHRALDVRVPGMRLVRRALDDRRAPENDVRTEKLAQPREQRRVRGQIEDETLRDAAGFVPDCRRRVLPAPQVAHDQRGLGAGQQRLRLYVPACGEGIHLAPRKPDRRVRDVHVNRRSRRAPGVDADSARRGSIAVRCRTNR